MLFEFMTFSEVAPNEPLKHAYYSLFVFIRSTTKLHGIIISLYLLYLSALVIGTTTTKLSPLQQNHPSLTNMWCFQLMWSKRFQF